MFNLAAKTRNYFGALVMSAAISRRAHEENVTVLRRALGVGVD